MADIPPQGEPLPRVPLTVDSLAAAVGAKMSFQNRALILGIQIVQALNRCAAAIEAEKGFAFRVHCSECRSRSWESRSDDGREMWCSACETKKEVNEVEDDAT